MLGIGGLKTRSRGSESRRRRPKAGGEQVRKQQANFFLEKGIQPEILPADEEFKLAEKKKESSATLTSSFRGLKNRSRNYHVYYSVS